MAQPLFVGIAGLGTVGAAVVKWIERERDRLTPVTGRDIRVVAVSARNRERDRGLNLAGIQWVNDPVALAASGNIDVFIELIGGEGEPAYSAVKTALQSGKAVITANKALIARHGMELAALAEQHKVPLSFEAAAAGALPVVRLFRDALSGQPVRRIRGILNGTCNYILTKMEHEGLAFEPCLNEAQRLGYAEADPTFDIDGHDTAHKLVLLSSLAFGTSISADGLFIEGIRRITPLDIKIAEELGFRIKLLGVAEKTADGIERRVNPVMIPIGTPIAEAGGVLNAVAIKADRVQEQTIVGPGAGGEATASAVISDLVDIARGFNEPAFGRPTSSLEHDQYQSEPKSEAEFYIRLTALDKIGSAGTIARRMAEQGISLESILQRALYAFMKNDGKTTLVPIILITYATTFEAVRRALANIEADGIIEPNPQVIRIERG